MAAEGAIVRYIHPGSRLGVLLEVNCETDFVAAGDVFTKLAGEIAMVVASSEVVCVSVDDMPGDLLAKEREVEMGKEDIKAKPEAVRAKVSSAVVPLLWCSGCTLKAIVAGQDAGALGQRG